MRYVIGADLGTSSLKLLLVDENGGIANEVLRTYPVEYPRPAWSEQHPEDWWNAFTDGVKELIRDIDAYEVVGMGFGGQMHGLVILDENDAVIRPAILWNDSRTDREVEYLNTQIGKERLSTLTANIAFAGFTAPKLLWVRKYEPENFTRITKIMLPKDYLSYRLTGKFVTDFSDASGTLLLDVEHKRWSREMLNICNISEEQLPRLAESYEVVGLLLPEIAEELGLSPAVTVVAGAGDNAAAAIGTGTVDDGKCNISLGTSGTVFVAADRFSVDKHNALHTFCHADGKYHLMGCILSAASCNSWFCSEILKSDDYAAEQQSIIEDKLGRNDVFFLPYLMGERSPINDTDARGTFTGLRLDTTRSDMVQAVLEGVAFAIKDNVEIARSLGIAIESSMLCGGGAKSALWQKILCNVLNMEIRIPQTEQGPGYGAAMLALVGNGCYETVRQCAASLINAKSTLLPQPEIVGRYERQYAKFKTIYPAMKDIFQYIK